VASDLDTQEDWMLSSAITGLLQWGAIFHGFQILTTVNSLSEFAPIFSAIPQPQISRSSVLHHQTEKMRILIGVMLLWMLIGQAKTAAGEKGRMVHLCVLCIVISHIV